MSGGKDSTALAIYMKDKIPDMEYVFCDTKKELVETYEYLDKIEAYLQKPIVRLCDDRGFDHWLEVYGGFLPSGQMRWCTSMLKIKPFEKYIGDDPIKMYVGIRADENRMGYVSTKQNIEAVYPFKDDGIRRDDVIRILEEADIGLPDYYSWRTRSGCYFCFFQRKSEWVGLLENHPELYELSKKYEKQDQSGNGFTWSQTESLVQLSDPKRVSEIKENNAKAIARESKHRPNQPLSEILADVNDGEDDDQACFFCHL